MGVRILSVDGNGQTCLFDSVTDWAFGPIASEDALEQFLEWLEQDARKYSQEELEVQWKVFCDSHENLFL